MLSFGPVIHDESKRSISRSGPHKSPNPHRQAQATLPVPMQPGEIEATAASLKRAVARHGFIQQQGFSKYHHATELLESTTKGAGCREYRLTTLGEALFGFLASAPLHAPPGSAPESRP